MLGIGYIRLLLIQTCCQTYKHLPLRCISNDTQKESQTQMGSELGTKQVNNPLVRIILSPVVRSVKVLCNSKKSEYGCQIPAVF